MMWLALFTSSILLSLTATATGQCDLKKNICKPVDFIKKRTKTETEEGCFYSQAIRSNVCYSVTFPKGFPATHDPQPYNLFLHGRGANNKQFSGFCEICAKDNKLPDCYGENGPPVPIVALSQTKHTYWKNSPDGKIKSEDLITKDTLAHLKANAPTLTTNPDMRGIMGISMGGHGSTYITMKHPDLFRAGLYAISPVFREEGQLELNDLTGFGSDHQFRERDPATLYKSNPSILNRNPFKIEIAPDDPFITEQESTKRFLQTVQKTHPDAVRIAGSGGHGIQYWCGALQRSMDFFKDRFRPRDTKKTPPAVSL